jgi:hypothetical protein
MTALAIANIIVLLALAAFTYFYMRHTGRLAEETRRMAHDTKRMADIMAREFELRIAPFIVIEQLLTSGGGPSKEYQPVICNKGSVPVLIKRIVLEWWYRDLRGETYRKEATVEKALGKNECTRLGDYVITLRPEDMVKENFEQGQQLDAPQLRALAQGKVCCVYADIDGREQQTGELRFLEML